MIPAFGHDNYGLATSHLGMKRKIEGDEDIPGASMRVVAEKDMEQPRARMLWFLRG